MSGKIDDKRESVLFRLFAWITIGIAFFLLCFLAVKLFPYYQLLFLFGLKLLMPFIIAGIIAYLLHPVIDKLQQLQLPRWLAVFVIYLVFFTVAGFAVYKAFPILAAQLREISENLPKLTSSYHYHVNNMYLKTANLPESVHDQMDLLLQALENRAAALIQKLLLLLNKIPQFILLAIVIPVIVFYLLKDTAAIRKFVLELAPRRHKEQLDFLLKKIDQSLGAYIRGVLLVSMIVSALTFFVFRLIGLPYALLLGLVIGATNIIPYFGPIIGLIPALIVAVTISPETALITAVTVFGVQVLEGNFLSPFIVGRSVHLHPLLIIFALLLGSEVGGIIGMILAVPLLTIVKVIVENVRKRAED